MIEISKIFATTDNFFHKEVPLDGVKLAAESEQNHSVTGIPLELTKIIDMEGGKVSECF